MEWVNVYGLYGPVSYTIKNGNEMKQHKHAELIKAWANGANIQQRINNEWVYIGNYTTWADGDMYRIQPDCGYAINKIRELVGDEAVDVYQHWLGGGDVECLVGSSYGTYLITEDPFNSFCNGFNIFELRKKKKVVKQVLWVITCEHPNIVTGCFFLDDGKEPSNYPSGYDCHKVPTCTRDVEA